MCALNRRFAEGIVVRMWSFSCRGNDANCSSLYRWDIVLSKLMMMLLVSVNFIFLVFYFLQLTKIYIRVYKIIKYYFLRLENC